MSITENRLPSLTPESRRIAAERFDRANQVIASNDFDYAIQLLLTCCKLDPANFLFRQTLRRTQKAKYRNNLRGSRLAFLLTFRSRAKLKSAKRSRDYARVLEYGEVILSRNPWDLGAQMDMAEACDALGMLDQAIFMLEQARQKNPKDATVNRALARLFERRGNFSHAILLWQLVKEMAPDDVEAAHKAKDLAASETIARGGYRESIEPEQSAAPTPPPSTDPDRTAVTTPAHVEDTAPTTSEVPERVTREAAPVLARLDANPTDPHLYAQLAAIYRRGNQPERARAVLEQGLGPTGNDFRLTLELMEMDIDVHRRNKALAEKKLNKAESGESRHAPEDLRKIIAKLDKEILSRETEIYRVKSDRFPQDSNNRLELGIRLVAANQIDEAIVEFQQARKDAKVAWKASLQLGLCFKKRNNAKLAQRNLEEALAQLPPNEESGRKEILYNLASGAAEAGDFQRAIDLGHDLANIDFGFRDIGKLLDTWESRLQEA